MNGTLATIIDTFSRSMPKSTLGRLVFASLGLLIALPAHSYIPNTRTILNRMVRASGHGLYQIEQEVQIRTEGDPIVLRERWLVENGENMQLSVGGAKGSTDGWKMEVGYRNGRRWFHEGDGSIKSAPNSLEFIEPYLHARSGKSLLETLIHQKILPANLVSMQRRSKSANGVAYINEAFVRLARTGGTVTYAFGLPTPSSATKASAGFWVEQDAFLFRRLRFPSTAEVEAEKYFFATGGLRIPRDRTVTWDGNSATIRILSAKSVSNSAQNQKRLSGSSFSTPGKSNSPRLPDHPLVKEFYQRFR